ncbi:MAG: phosphotransferase [Gammaproteobacteria bacterium]
MNLPPPVRENLRFLVVEVASQVDSLRSYLASGSETVARRVLGRAGYALNLKTRIHDSCMAEVTHIAARNGADADPALLALRAVENIATDLERITDHGRECVSHMEDVKRRGLLNPEDYDELLEQVARGLDLVEPALDDDGNALSLKLARVNKRLERAYGELLEAHVADIKREKKKHTDDLVSALFVAHAIGRMGDALQACGEAIVSAKLGQTVNMAHFRSLREAMDKLAGEDDNALRVHTVAQTRSGSAITGITRGADGDAYLAIYKDGEKRKLKEERKGVRNWHEVYPGLAPRILAYDKRGTSASLLVEHLAGQTLEQILLHGSDALLGEALTQLTDTLTSVWDETRRKKPVNAGFMEQAAKRMTEVYAVHPDFAARDTRICGVEAASFDRLLRQAARREGDLDAPFSVYIHGDFNVDNVIYDPDERRINFIDLHRSRYMDYVQDISVFMVSNYRLRVLDRPMRRRILALARDFHDFAAAYARKRNDDTFELRLALGLARSFATSTRFILDRTLARRMYLRSGYLLRQVADTPPGRESGYQVPIEELFVA